MKPTLIAALVCTASLILSCASTQPANPSNPALAELRAKAEAGDAQSQFELGAAFSLGKFGMPTNYVEAVKWWRKAAE